MIGRVVETELDRVGIDEGSRLVYRTLNSKVLLKMARAPHTSVSQTKSQG